MQSPRQSVFEKYFLISCSCKDLITRLVLRVINCQKLVVHFMLFISQLTEILFNIKIIFCFVLSLILFLSFLWSTNFEVDSKLIWAQCVLQISRTFSPCTSETVVSHWTAMPHFPILLVLETTVLHSLSVNFTVLDILYK